MARLTEIHRQHQVARPLSSSGVTLGEPLGVSVVISVKLLDLHSSPSSSALDR
jgi:hypothetical protein